MTLQNLVHRPQGARGSLGGLFPDQLSINVHGDDATTVVAPVLDPACNAPDPKAGARGACETFSDTDALAREDSTSRSSWVDSQTPKLSPVKITNLQIWWIWIVLSTANHVHYSYHHSGNTNPPGKISIPAKLQNPKWHHKKSPVYFFENSWI
jgi:hypothetical protein